MIRLFMFLVLFGVWFALFEQSDKGSSLGKKIMGLAVVHEKKAKIGFKTALARYFISMGISLVTLGLGFFLKIFSSKDQAIQDELTKTNVVDLHKTHRVNKNI